MTAEVGSREVATPESGTPRSTDLRLTRLHLRMGALELARAELEALAGGGELDDAALLDLAEVRWRTGDLAGAGVAAEAYLGAGRDDVLALVIAAEASAAAGHPGEARAMVSRVLGHAEADLDQVFAGMPRSWMWPLEPSDEPAPVTDLFPDAVRPMAQAPGTAAAEGSALASEPVAEVGAGSVEVHDAELDAARAALAAGDPAAAADRLGELLRSRPDLAVAVLAALERSSRTDDRPRTSPDDGPADPRADGPLQ